VPVRELTVEPSTLPLMAKAAAGLIPGASRLPFLGGGGGEVPDLTLVLSDVTVDRDRLAAYDRVCGFSLRDSPPVTYPHILAFPLHLSLLTDPSFPFTPIGLVHIYNRISQHRPIAVSEALSLRVSATPAEPCPNSVWSAGSWVCSLNWIELRSEYLVWPGRPFFVVIRMTPCPARDP